MAAVAFRRPRFFGNTSFGWIARVAFAQVTPSSRIFPPQRLSSPNHVFLPHRGGGADPGLVPGRRRGTSRGGTSPPVCSASLRKPPPPRWGGKKWAAKSVRLVFLPISGGEPAPALDAGWPEGPEGGISEAFTIRG